MIKNYSNDHYFDLISSSHSSSSNFAFHFFVSLSFILRPTSAIPFVIIYPYLFYKTSNRLRFLLQAFLCFILLNLINICLDSYMYNQWTFVPLNFFYINFLHPNSISSHYGINNFFWYFTNGLPMIYFYRLPFVFLGAMSNKRLTIIILFTIFIYTLNIHKEFRFLTQILPLLFILEAHGIDWCLKTIKWKQFRWIIFLSFLGHLFIGIYFSLIDRQGQISVMNYLRIGENKSVDFLMPCHSTPYYNFLHRNDIQLHFLTCEPNLNQMTNDYIDEADRFYLKPIESLKKRLKDYNPSHLIMFDTLYEQLKDVLEDDQGFFVKNILFNSHIQHSSRHGKMIYILQKD
jgi:phosphatidylinositol glycan class B